MWSCELFETDLNNKTYMELADWLTSCRQVVLRKNFDSHADYLCAVEAFCSEWEEFYRQNEDFFKNKHERFKKAVLFASYKKNITCMADYGTKEIIPSESVRNLSLVEKLLNFNGYTIKDKSRQFDVICEKAFRIGFGREYTIALIEKHNAELGKRFDVFNPMPTITKIKKQQKI